MEHGQYDLEGALVLLFVHVHRNAAAVVDDGYRVIFVDSDTYILCITCKGLVDRVVHDFVDKVMKAFGRDVANIHGRAFAHGLQTFEDLDFISVVILSVF